jgi:hypothetical protein
VDLELVSMEGRLSVYLHRFGGRLNKFRHMKHIAPYAGCVHACTFDMYFL